MLQMEGLLSIMVIKQLISIPAIESKAVYSEN